MVRFKLPRYTDPKLNFSLLTGIFYYLCVLGRLVFTLPTEHSNITSSDSDFNRKSSCLSQNIGTRDDFELQHRLTSPFLMTDKHMCLSYCVRTLSHFPSSC